MLLKAIVWYIPQATETILLFISLIICLGEAENILPPNPNDPNYPFPNVNKEP